MHDIMLQMENSHGYEFFIKPYLNDFMLTYYLTKYAINRFISDI